MAIFMQRFGSQAYALLRIVSGFTFLWHGAQKLFAFPIESGAPDWIVYTAGPIEFIGGILIMIGLCTRWVAFIASGMAAVAYWLVHAKQGWLPLVNKGEIVTLYCFIFLYISTQGAGIWSVDGMRSKPGG